MNYEVITNTEENTNKEVRKTALVTGDKQEHWL